MVERRLKWLAWIVVVWGAVIFYKLISLQVFHHQEYVRHGAGAAGAFEGDSRAARRDLRPQRPGARHEHSDALRLRQSR